MEKDLALYKRATPVDLFPRDLPDLLMPFDNYHQHPADLSPKVNQGSFHPTNVMGLEIQFLPETAFTLNHLIKLISHPKSLGPHGWDLFPVHTFCEAA